ncbi:MAG: hypothetical protein CM15mP95_2690 [Alphaproteobacteria bacterium]|nr:MAG: hypothetical protein CM15mP95_2690 [Alphaproteobacteria bacterium]
MHKLDPPPHPKRQKLNSLAPMERLEPAWVAEASGENGLDPTDVIPKGEAKWRHCGGRCSRQMHSYAHTPNSRKLGLPVT